MPFLQPFWNFFERKWTTHGGGISSRRDGFAESQPQPVQQVHFIRRQVRRMRAQHLVHLVAIGKMNFQVELRLGIAQFFPRHPQSAGPALPLIPSANGPAQ